VLAHTPCWQVRARQPHPSARPPASLPACPLNIAPTLTHLHHRPYCSTYMIGIDNTASALTMRFWGASTDPSETLPVAVSTPGSCVLGASHEDPSIPPQLCTCCLPLLLAAHAFLHVLNPNGPVFGDWCWVCGVQTCSSGVTTVGGQVAGLPDAGAGGAITNCPSGTYAVTNEYCYKCPTGYTCAGGVTAVGTKVPCASGEEMGKQAACVVLCTTLLARL